MGRPGVVYFASDRDGAQPLGLDIAKALADEPSRRECREGFRADACVAGITPFGTARDCYDELMLGVLVGNIFQLRFDILPSGYPSEGPVGSHRVDEMGQRTSNSK